MITNCSNNYGPHQHPEKLIPKLIYNIINNKPLLYMEMERILESGYLLMITVKLCLKYLKMELKDNFIISDLI